MVDCVSPHILSQLAANAVTDTFQNVGKNLALKSPFIDILEGSILPNEPDVVREHVILPNSLVTPAFVDDISQYGVSTTLSQYGLTEYTYPLQSLRGSGPRVCLKTDIVSFESSYLAAQEALERGIRQIMNADIRWLLASRSGIKFICRNDQPFSNLLTGDMQEIDTAYAPYEPNAALSFKALHKMGQFLREEMIADPFESEMGTYFKFIGSVDQIERFRNKLDVKEDLLALTKGRYMIGEERIDSYSFQGPYSGYAFGIDPQPLRATIAPNGVPVFVEPEIGTPTTKGVGSRRNPAWVAAQYEVGFLVAANTFERQVPERYLGQGSLKFNPQLSMGELDWLYVRDNDCNRYGDFGQHIYQIQRAYRPVHPQNVVAILSMRKEVSS